MKGKPSNVPLPSPRVIKLAFNPLLRGMSLPEPSVCIFSPLTLCPIVSTSLNDKKEKFDIGSK